MLASITESLKKNEEVAIMGFGTFKVSHRPARKGRNLKTGEIIDVKASKSPAFKAGRTLKEAIK